MDDAIEMIGMKAQCFDFDRIAVKCFDRAIFNVTVSLTYSNKKISCRAKVRFQIKSTNCNIIRPPFIGLSSFLFSPLDAVKTWLKAWASCLLKAMH